jgi:tetratricopeptide (TPR) repeat protein
MGKQIEASDARVALQLARTAFANKDTEAERRALASVEIEFLSDSQFARLIALHLGAHAQVDTFADLVLGRRFESQQSLMRLALLLTSRDHLDLACKVLQAAVHRGTTWSRPIVYWTSLVIERLERSADVIAVLNHPCSLGWAPWLRAVVWGKVKAASDETEQALSLLQDAVSLAPNEPAAWYEIAVLQRRIGLADESMASLRKTIELDPDNVTARRLLGYEHRYLPGDTLLHELEHLAGRLPTFLPATQVELHYALAKAYEDIGELDACFDSYAAGGRIQKRISPWHYRRQLALNARLMEQATTDWIAAETSLGARSERPILIVGMPRSGTTLVEQMIASHPDAFGAGELKTIDRLLHGVKVGTFTLLTCRESDVHRDAVAPNATLRARGDAYLETLQRLAPSQARVIDKMPGNFQWVGLISAMLPEGRFIHCRRHPLDTCLSQYRLYFGSEVPFSYDLRDLGRAYRAYHDLMKHWTTIVSPERLFAIRYEDLVSEFERNSRELVHFCGLTWNDACLDYANSSRQVRTASAAQVRAAPHTTAIGRWRRYRSYIDPLIDEIGDLVEEYERELDSRTTS